MKDDIDRILKEEGPLKARQIASKLDIERKQISAFLHAHPKDYQQNSEYEWCCLSGLEIVLPSRWITAKNFENILLRSGYTDAEEKVTIVLSERSSTLIECTARLLALSNQLANSRKTVVIDFSKAEGIASYLNRAGFFDLLDPRINVLPQRPAEKLSKKYRGQSDNLVEFRSIDPSSANSELIDELTNKFVQLTSSDYKVAALTIFGELIGNVFDHSQTTLKGFAGLQKYKGRIQAVVSESLF